MSELALLPYRRRGVGIPEMSRPRLIFAVCYGAFYWVVRELPLLACWAFFFCLTLGAFIADQFIPNTPFTLVYVGTPIVYVWMFTGAFTLMLTALRAVLLILRSKWAIGITILLAVIVFYVLY